MFRAAPIDADNLAQHDVGERPRSDTERNVRLRPDMGRHTGSRRHVDPLPLLGLAIDLDKVDIVESVGLSTIGTCFASRLWVGVPRWDQQVVGPNRCGPHFGDHIQWRTVRLLRVMRGLLPLRCLGLGHGTPAPCQVIREGGSRVLHGVRRYPKGRERGGNVFQSGAVREEGVEVEEPKAPEAWEGKFRHLHSVDSSKSG